jgi:hypothetical protein
MDVEKAETVMVPIVRIATYSMSVPINLKVGGGDRMLRKTDLSTLIDLVNDQIERTANSQIELYDTDELLQIKEELNKMLG